MWTDTCYYNFPTIEEMPLPEGDAAIDEIGATASGYLVNVRWWQQAPAGWEAFQITAPAFPKRVFA